MLNRLNKKPNLFNNCTDLSRVSSLYSSSFCFFSSFLLQPASAETWTIFLEATILQPKLLQQEMVGGILWFLIHRSILQLNENIDVLLGSDPCFWRRITLNHNWWVMYFQSEGLHSANVSISSLIEHCLTSVTVTVNLENWSKETWVVWDKRLQCLKLNIIDNLFASSAHSTVNGKTVGVRE